uniref:Pyrroline-5-carboxylate reductase 3 n=1 Tax=Camelus bactrianus TaxID=9837 RepID=A0A9W3GE59_CAMBA|nr:pyrroline-5-carboxylate reductase 3 isoform X1 [Camelus bactrianus]
MAAEAAESLPRRVGFVGAGRMAEAVAQGLIRAGKVEAQHVLASAPTDRNPSHFRALGCQTTHSNLEVLQGCSLVFFATKPHVLPAVLAEVAPVVTAEHILVSVAAGVSLSTLEELLPPTARVLRVSPNLPCVVQEGALVMARGRHAGSSEVELLRTLLEACGQCEEVPEAHVDVHTGLSGSGVAFVCAFSEALAEGAIKMGMPSGLAHRITAQTLLVRPCCLAPEECVDRMGDSQDASAGGAAPGPAADGRVHAGWHHHLWAARAGAGWAACSRHERRGGCHLPGQGDQPEIGHMGAGLGHSPECRPSLPLSLAPSEDSVGQ